MLLRVNAFPSLMESLCKSILSTGLFAIGLSGVFGIFFVGVVLVAEVVFVTGAEADADEPYDGISFAAISCELNAFPSFLTMRS